MTTGVTTPAPTPLHNLTFAERFWAHARGPESEDVPEPLRSIVIVRHFLAVLDRVDVTSPRKAAPALVGMLRQSELEGDLSYASPEQVRGEILDTRSVVFSLGVVLFERLTGRHPFGAENNRPRRIDRIRRGEMGSGVNSFPTVAAGLRSVLVRAMSPFPEERWPDLRQMRELLGQFVTQEAPPPRLPGTQSDVTPGDGVTKVVRMATDFGRELMQVVAKHDHEPPRRRATEPPPLPRASQRTAVPSAGVGVVTGATAPARRSQSTPGRGLRAVPPPPAPAPSQDSVVTRIREPDVDPLGQTALLVVDDPELAREMSRTAAAPDPAPPPPAPAPIATAPRPRPLSAPLPLAPPAPSGSFTAMPDLRPPRRTAVVAAVSATGGALVAVALVFALRSSPPGAAAAASAAPVADPAPVPAAGSAPASAPAPAPAPAAAAAAPAPAAAAAPAPAAAADPAPTAAADPAPAADSAPAAGAAPSAEPALGVTFEQRLADAIAPCFAAGHGGRTFGLSPLYKAGTITKAYLGGAESLSAGERGCVSRTVKGLALPGTPASGNAQFRVRLDAAGVTISPM